jgi:hypothetical protein
MSQKPRPPLVDMLAGFFGLSRRFNERDSTIALDQWRRDAETDGAAGGVHATRLLATIRLIEALRGARDAAAQQRRDCANCGTCAVCNLGEPAPPAPPK